MPASVIVVPLAGVGGSGGYGTLEKVEADVSEGGVETSCPECLTELEWMTELACTCNFRGDACAC